MLICPRFLVLALFLLARAAHGLPAPMAEKELVQLSDFIGEVEVLDVVRVGDDGGKYQEPVAQYNAWLQVVNVAKGKHKLRDTLVSCWSELPKSPFVGGWYVSFAKHEKVFIYLKWHEDKHCYSATSWNSKTILQ